MKKTTDGTGITGYLGNASFDRTERRKLLLHSVTHKSEESSAVQDFLLDACEQFSAHATADQDEATYRARLIDLERGPARPAAFLGFLDPGGNRGHRRGLVVFEDGSEAVSCVSDELAARLSGGDTVLVDPRASVIIAQDGNRPFAGEIATLEKRVGDASILVRLSNDERCVLHMASVLRKKVDDRTVEPGALIVANVRQRLAFCDVPPDDDKRKHFRFVDRAPLPDITTGKVGAPNPIISDVYEHVLQELSHPETRRAYGLPRSFFALLLGPPGTGKTHTMQAIERQTYDLVSRHLGIAAADLPRRSLTLSIPSIISKYLGESDRNLAAFAHECFEMAKIPVKGADGMDHILPLIVKCEELDGLAGRRSDGDFDGGSMNRVLTTFLGLFDPARTEFRDSVIIVLSTSNRPHAVDLAALRRFGMKTYSFGRLTRRRPFEAVLMTQLMPTPLACSQDQEAARRQTVDEISSWLFAEQDQDPIVDLAFVGSAETVTKVRRDFLTPALVNRALIAAATGACARELQGIGARGLQVAELMASIDAQVRSIAENQLSVDTVRDHLDIPDGVRVATVKRRQKPMVPQYQAVRPDSPAAVLPNAEQ